MLQEFKAFITKGNVLAVAVALIMALYFKSIVDALLEGVILPIISAIFGEPNYENIGFDLGDARVSIGLVINAIISFVVVAFVLFLIVEAYNKMRPEEASAPTEVQLLTEIRDALQNR